MKTGTIYKHTFPDGSLYIGQSTIPLFRRFRKGKGYKYSPKIWQAICEFGWESVKTEILYSNIPVEELRRYETLCIDRYNTYMNGLNCDRGQGHVSDEARQAMSESALKRVEEGTHQFCNSEWQSEINRRRVADGTHHLLGDSNPTHRRIADGTHNLLGSETNGRRVANGTHPFLGGDLQRQRVADGTHNLLGGEIQRETNRRRVADGTHIFLGDDNPSRRRALDGTHHLFGTENNWKWKKRRKAEWMWIRSLAMCWYEMNDYVMKRRQEFYNKDIPDTSQSIQLEIF